MDEAAIADIFAAFRPVRCRRMFGGYGLYAEGVMFGVFVGERIYLKADAELARTLEGEGAEAFTYERSGKRVALGFWSLPEAALDDADAAAELAGRALRVALAAAAARPPERRRSPRSPRPR
ncbi:Uncharacterised protein [Starkeya nomas]|uniref:TfoX N-terminal domain-containing protein n=1 Tax=Starkeya nomas TaxID=2666134 RepID=A0A5S9NHT1_9HYPH|nr:TfoX/Sxy family protein [Starkeya nomas]CAA0089258.1 Uncharacterised protein [Starkeya nomas]